MITFMPMLMWMAALIVAGAALYVSSQALTPSNIGRSLLRWLFVFPLGTMAIWDFVTYGFLPQTVADRFGWAPSPFQMEVAFANLGLGAASLYAAFVKRPARIAVALVAACFLVGSGLSLVNNILDGDDLAAGVAGAILLKHFLTPVVVLLLLFLGPQTEEAVAATTATGDRSRQDRPPQPGPSSVASPPSAPPASWPQEPAPWRAPPTLEPLKPPSRPAPPLPRALPSPQPTPRPQPQRYPPPQAPAQPRPNPGGFDQSLEDELERARRQMMEDLAKGRKPGS